MAIAFFDMDNTLLATNSGRAWLRRELELGHLTRYQALRAALWLVQYSFGLRSLERAVEKAIGSLAGREERAFRDRTQAFYTSHVRPFFRPGGIKALEAHRRAGDRLVLLTASSTYLSELVTEELKLDGFLCNRLEVDERGCYTGKALGGICFGKGKLSHAEKLAQEAGVPLADCHFYTDSYSDLPV